MKKEVNIMYKVLVFFTIICSVQCFPITLSVTEQDNDREEVMYPNGTIMGKYAYVDKDGNPIHVKYFADESSYGVELNSLKMLNQNSNNFSTDKDQNAKKVDPLTMDSRVNMNGITDFLKYQSMKRSRPNNEKENKASSKHHKANSDYEVYQETEIGLKKHCSNNPHQIRVYDMLRVKRKGRENYRKDSYRSFNAPKICGIV